MTGQLSAVGALQVLQPTVIPTHGMPSSGGLLGVCPQIGFPAWLGGVRACLLWGQTPLAQSELSPFSQCLCWAGSDCSNLGSSVLAPAEHPCGEHLPGGPV